MARQLNTISFIFQLFIYCTWPDERVLENHIPHSLKFALCLLESVSMLTRHINMLAC